jgi:uncharacterized protein involved in response to NO
MQCYWYEFMARLMNIKANIIKWVKMATFPDKNNPMKNSSALFSIGFRPFFLLASLTSGLLLFAWLMVYAFAIKLPAFGYYPAIIWHGHEMVFGYAMAVVAGFLLTAIRNWTGVPTLSGKGLMLLTSIWIIGRIAPFVIPSAWLIALADGLFLPLLAIFVAIPLLKVKNKRNYFVIGMVVLMASLNILVHLELLHLLNGVAELAIKSAFYVIIALIIVMAGRVFPMFSQNGVPMRYQVVKYAWIEKLAMPSYLLFAISLLFIDNPLLLLITALLAVCIHFIRLKGWYNPQIWQVPLVWILHVGYLFLIIGFVVTALSAYQPQWYFLALHAFSIGVLGIITVGMMARVSIGHTGRDLRNPPKVLKAVFALMILATLFRVFVPLLLQENYRMIMVVSASFWVLAFVLLVWKYFKIWIGPRVDGK